MNATKLRALLEAANQDIDQLVLFRNNHLPALLDRLDKLEELRELCARGFCQYELDEALAALEDSNDA